jgi:hypothetical protein
MSQTNPQNTRAVGKVSDLQGTFHIDTWLTNFSVQFRQDAKNFVAGFAATPVPVQKESDKYAIYPRGYFWRDEAEVRPLGGRPVQVSYKVETGQYLCEEWALEHTIDDRQRANADSIFTLDETGTRLLEGKQMIREDRMWATTFFQTGVWTHDYQGGQHFTPFNDASSTPIETIDEYKTAMAQSTGFMPNTIVMGANVHNALRSNADIVDRIKYTQRGIASLDVLASLFEVDRVMTARSVYNAAAEGATDDFEFIVDPNAMWIGYIEPTPSMDAPTAIARFGWTGLFPGQTNQSGGVIMRGRDDRATSDWIQSRNAYDYKLVSADLGIFLEYANSPLSN